MVYSSSQVYELFKMYIPLILAEACFITILDILSYRLLFSILRIPKWKSSIPFYRKNVLAKRYNYSLSVPIWVFFPITFIAYFIIMREVRKCVAEELGLGPFTKFIFCNTSMIGNYTVYCIWRHRHAYLHKKSGLGTIEKECKQS